jgi:hypothetical protein
VRDVPARTQSLGSCATNDGSHYNHFIDHGLVPAEHEQLGGLLQAPQARQALDGFVGRIGRATAPSGRSATTRASPRVSSGTCMPCAGGGEGQSSRRAMPAAMPLATGFWRSAHACWLLLTMSRPVPGLTPQLPQLGITCASAVSPGNAATVEATARDGTLSVAAGRLDAPVQVRIRAR